jgi:HEAT repeat protein
VTTLADAERPARRTLTEALQTISTEARAEVAGLVLDLQRGDPDTRARTAETLGAIGADANAAKATLVTALAEPDLPGEVRFTLAEALGEIGAYTTEVTRALVDAALRDPDPEVRGTAQDSLGEQTAEA